MLLERFQIQNIIPTLNSRSKIVCANFPVDLFLNTHTIQMFKYFIETKKSLGSML